MPTTRSPALSVRRKEEMSMTDFGMTGVERYLIEEAQAKLQQRRYERDHFSDGVPVEMYEGLQPVTEDQQQWLHKQD